MNYVNNKVSIFFIRQLILVSTKLHFKCGYGDWPPSINQRGEGARQAPPRPGGDIRALLRNCGGDGGGSSPVVRCDPFEAQPSPDRRVCPALRPFLSDSMWENFLVGFIQSVHGRKAMMGKLAPKPKPVVIRVVKTRCLCTE